MKKIMILMLSLAVLFSFAACDNSSTTPAGGDDQTVDTTDYAYLAVTAGMTEGDGVIATLNQVASMFAKDTQLMTAGAEADKYSVDLANNSFTYTESSDDVGGLAGTSLVITVSGKDVTADADKATEKTIVLDSYTIEFSIENPDADVTGVLAPITGKMSGKIMGVVEATGLTNSVVGTGTSIKVSAISNTYYKSGLTTSQMPTEVIAFYPAEAGDVESLTYLGNPVTDKDAFVKYLNSDRVNEDAKIYATTTATTSLATGYEAAVKKAYATAVWTDVKENVVELASAGLADMIKDDPAASGLKRETTFTSGATESSAVITISNNTQGTTTFTSASGKNVFALGQGDTVTITLSGLNVADGTGTSFTATNYSITGKLAVYATGTTTFEDSKLNADYGYVEIKDLAGAFASGSEFTVAREQKTDGSYGVADLSSETVTFTDCTVTGGTIDTEITANVLPGIVGAGTTADPYVFSEFGPVSVNCAKEAN